MKPDEVFPPGLIDRVKRGDDAAFAELVNIHQQSVRSFVACCSPSRGEADEIAQDVFLSALYSLDTFDKKKDFRAWLLDIARNMTRNAWRRAARSTQRSEVNELAAMLERHAQDASASATGSDECTEYFAERHSQGTLDAKDVAEMAVRFKEPQAAQKYVKALAERYDKRPQSNDAFVKAVLERKQGKAGPTRIRERPAQESKTRGSSVLYTTLAACALSVVLIYLFTHGQKARDTLQHNSQVAPTAEAKPANAKLTQSKGRVQIHRGELTKDGADGTELFIGDVIETGSGFTVVSYDGESTTLSLSSGTELQMNVENDSRRPRLLKGSIDVIVSGAKEPVIIFTPSAEMQTLGSEVTLGIEDKDTIVQVHAGNVHMTRQDDGVVIDMTAGNSKIVSTEHPVRQAATPMTLNRPWRERDIGVRKSPGSATQKEDAFTLRVTGGDLSGKTDGFHFVYQPLNGDCEITTQIVSITGAQDSGLAGIMVRETLAPDSPHATLAVTTEGKVTLQRRLSIGEASEVGSSGRIPTPLPRWLKLTRSGDLFTTYASADGAVWNLVDEVTVRMNENVFVGLVLLSQDKAAECTGAFESVKLLRLMPP